MFELKWDAAVSVTSRDFINILLTYFASKVSWFNIDVDVRAGQMIYNVPFSFVLYCLFKSLARNVS